MKFYGYEKDSDDLINLEEVTMECSLEEIKKLITFLEIVKERHENVTDICHTHYRDWDKEWENSMPDLIIATVNKENS